MMRKSTWSLIGLLVLLAACGFGKIDAQFEQEELAWLYYQPADTISLVDSTGQEMKIYATELTDQTQVNQRYPIEAEVTLINAYTEEEYRIYILKDEIEFKRYIRLSDVYRSLDLVDMKASLNLGGQVYENVYLIPNVDRAKIEMPSDTAEPIEVTMMLYYTLNSGFVGIKTNYSAYYPYSGT